MTTNHTPAMTDAEFNFCLLTGMGYVGAYDPETHEVRVIRFKQMQPWEIEIYSLRDYRQAAANRAALAKVQA